MTVPIKKTSRIMKLRTPEVSSTLKETNDNVEFATDMEELVCEGSEEHNQQERHPHGNTEFTSDFSKSSQKRLL